MVDEAPLRWSELDQLDRRLILTLQIAPLLPWTKVAEVLGVERSTPRRRWENLQDQHAAHISVERVQPSFDAPHRLIRVRAIPSHHAAVAEQLIDMPYVRSVFLPSGTDEILAYSMATEEEASFRDIYQRAAQTDGIRQVTLSYVTGVLRRVGQYQLRPVGQAEKRIVARTRQALLSTTHGPESSHLDVMSPVASRALLKQLRNNARTPLQDLNAIENAARSAAGLPEVSPATTRRERRAILDDPKNRVRLWVPTRPASAVLYVIYSQHHPRDRSRLAAALTQLGEHILWSAEVTGRLNGITIVTCPRREVLEEVLDGLTSAGACDLVAERLYGYAWGRASGSRGRFLWPIDSATEHRIRSEAGLAQQQGEPPTA